jgi:hypothetical protein
VAEEVLICVWGFEAAGEREVLVFANDWGEKFMHNSGPSRRVKNMRV